MVGSTGRNNKFNVCVVVNNRPGLVIFFDSTCLSSSRYENNLF